MWRGFANRQLDGPYRALFARIDRLVLLAAPGFDVVAGWRGEQESALRASAAPGSPGLMDDTALVRFVAHYERLTRHILKEMPARADVVLRLDGARRVVQVSRKGG